MSTTLPRSAAAVLRLSDTELIKAAIAATPDPRPEANGEPMPATEFAARVAMCNPRTVRRYLAGERPLTPLLRAKCREIVDAARAATRAPVASAPRRAKARA